jgi:hypothetical protein
MTTAAVASTVVDADSRKVVIRRQDDMKLVWFGFCFRSLAVTYMVAIAWCAFVNVNDNV